MAHQPVEKLPHAPLEVIRLPVQLRQRFRETVRDLHVASLEFPHQLDIVIARHTQRRPVRHHGHHQPEHPRRVRAAIHQIANKHRPPPLRVVRGGPAGRAADGIAQLLQQCDKLIEAAVNVADDVERAMLLPPVNPQRLPHDTRSLDHVRRAQDRDVAKALAPQVAERAPQLLTVLPDHVGTEVAVGPVAVALLAQLGRQVEDNSYRQHVGCPCQLHQRLACLRLNVGCIDHREPASREALAGDEVEHLEGIFRRGLVVFVIRHQPAAVVG